MNSYDFYTVNNSIHTAGELILVREPEDYKLLNYIRYPMPSCYSAILVIGEIK